MESKALALLPVFIFICRKKDEGMPPRRIQVPVAPWSPIQADAPAIEKPVEETPVPEEVLVAEEPTEE